MAEVSAVIITKNEEANIGRCLDSVAWADEIVVVDSGSTDDTCQLATEKGALVYKIDWRGYGPAKAFSVEKASKEWVLSIDADEEVSNELRDEIKAVLSDSPAHAGYDMPRLTRFLDRWIRHCGWYPDRVLRLFHKDHGNFNDAAVHEKVVLNGSLGHLRGHLLHWCYPTLDHYLTKSNRYTTLGAEQAFETGKRAGWFDITLRPAASFVSHYVIRQGFRDGLEGFLVSSLSAMAVLSKYAKLRTMQKEAVKTAG
jgi:glycosyltransferase involved in cell wall biosynthesis